jgi:hypothetical protein
MRRVRAERLSPKSARSGTERRVSSRETCSNSPPNTRLCSGVGAAAPGRSWPPASSEPFTVMFAERSRASVRSS